MQMGEGAAVQSEFERSALKRVDLFIGDLPVFEYPRQQFQVVSGTSWVEPRCGGQSIEQFRKDRANWRSGFAPWHR